MIPLVGVADELDQQAAVVRKAAEKVQARTGDALAQTSRKSPLHHRAGTKGISGEFEGNVISACVSFTRSGEGHDQWFNGTWLQASQVRASDC
eukprot:scaffold36035_cov16-Tisochrysis_lutea.AAC.1